MSLIATVEFYSSAPGFLMYAGDSENALRDGGDYRADDPAVKELTASGAFLFVDTGSPQLDYEMHVHTGEPTADVGTASRAHTTAGMEVRGGLRVRDGYDTMRWSADGSAVHRVDLPDGRWRIEAYWLPSRARSRMVIHAFFVRDDETALPGRVNLDYIVL